MSICTIQEINSVNKHNFNKMNEPFYRFGNVNTIFINKKWSYEIELLQNPYKFCLPIDSGAYCNDYIDNENRQIFFAIVDGVYIGQIRISKHWNGLCFIEDVCIKSDYRGKGYFKELLNAAERWSVLRNLKGLYLEVLSFNVAAFKTYIKHGFDIGGIDNMEYRYAQQDFILKDDINIKMYKSFVVY